MGLFTSKRTSKPTGRKARKAQLKAEAKAIKARAKLEAKLGDKTHRKALKDDRKQELKLAKQGAKIQEKQDKARVKVAEENAKAAADGKALSTARVKRYLQVAKLVAPVLAPLAYRGATLTRAQLTAFQANRAGVPIEEYGKFSGHGAALSARIAAAQRSLDRLVADQKDAAAGAEAKVFAQTMRTRLQELSDAVQTAEHMPSARRKGAHRAIERELGGIDADLLARSGVHA
ncbi:DUF6474 family protein [Williamsia sterculiae]|uniref:Uncharacterized protein n=1 Tax=Williamsia sterculiae TaxID=1344003 RepID=A0A1N7H9U2_9NOCA|nr:DUF6474 family protein [Williamsia sterculiae]SIS21460.1 hypothetical protein SAMN05445060_3755 [Williamsia sterculiae]